MRIMHTFKDMIRIIEERKVPFDEVGAVREGIWKANESPLTELPSRA